METQDKPNGRPRAISSPEEMDEKVDAYVARCQEREEPITLTGMILALGLSSRQSFDEYAKYDGFSDSVKRAKMIIEHSYEIKLATNGCAPAASIFALKNFGWRDTQHVEANVKNVKTLSDFYDEQSDNND